MDIDKYEQYIFREQFQLDRMSVLQRNSRTRLQVIEMNGQTYIRSINDRYKSIRVIVLALMIHIYQRNDQDKINQFKAIIYQSQLEHLTVSRGLLKEQLQRTFGQSLRQACKHLNIEHQFIKCFNCIAFFDQIVISSFSKHFCLDQTYSFGAWENAIREHFQIPISLIQKNTLSLQNRADGIELIQDCNVIYLQSGYSKSIEVESIAGSGSIIDEFQVQQRKDLMLVPIQSCDSPLLNKNKENIGASYHSKSRKIQAFEGKLSLSRNKSQQRSIFWSIFCCGD